MSRPRRKSNARVRTVTAALAVIGAFLIGVAVGAALGGGPEPSTTTYERTLKFATVTVTEP